jgi:hypothetical protein
MSDKEAVNSSSSMGGLDGVGVGEGMDPAGDVERADFDDLGIDDS